MRVEIIFDEYSLHINKNFVIDTELSIASVAAAARAEAAAQRAEGQPLYSDQLRSDIYAEDSTPYLYRASYSGDREYDKLVGGSVGWNQLCNASSVTVRSGHKYYMVKGGTRSLGSSTGSAITGLTSGTDIVVDLTLLLGSSLADYLYILESGSAGAGVALLKKWGFCTKDYYPYDAGSLLSVQTSAHEMVGFNQWDEEWELGGINSSTGAPTTNSDRIRSKNFCRCFPSTNYYATNNALASGMTMYIWYYDAGQNFVSGAGKNNIEFTTPANARYFKLSTYGGSYTTYKGDLCINLSDPVKNGTYAPYVKHTYPLDSSLTLRGVPKKDANNNFYYDGDTYKADGTVTRKYGIVDLGTLTWSLHGTYSNVFYAYVSDKKAGYENVLCPNYTTTSAALSSMENYTIRGHATTSATVYIKDTRYSTGANFKTAMSGVRIVYELATPTTETADPYQELQIVDEYGTEEYIDSRTVPVPVGHNTRYPTNQVAKLDGLPADFSTLIAPTEKTYKATRAYTSGSLLIVNNILYKATSAISNGATLTVGTNITATTLAQVIAAL